VLEGSVRLAGKRLRVVAQLIDSQTGSHIWADKFDGSADDIFDMQDRITESVVAVVEPQIRLAEIERSRRERPGSLAAYDLYLRALPKFNAETPADNAEAFRLLSRRSSSSRTTPPRWRSRPARSRTRSAWAGPRSFPTTASTGRS
jgi:adenylate cyclase